MSNEEQEREEWEKEANKKVFESREPEKVTIHEAYHLYYGANHAQIGKFKRKVKGHTYTSPRILLKHYFKKYIGKRVMIIEGKASIEGWSGYQNKDVLIFFL